MPVFQKFFKYEERILKLIFDGTKSIRTVGQMSRRAGNIVFFDVAYKNLIFTSFFLTKQPQ